MPTAPPDFDRLLGSGYLDGLGDRSLDEVRASRDELAEAESVVSYLRRIVQGRLDIVHAEVERRRHGGRPRPLGELVEELPSILAEGATGSGPGRLPVSIDPSAGSVDTSEVDRIADVSQLEDLPSVSEADLSTLQDEFAELERQVSQRRRLIHERLDAVNGEIVRRYRSGEATVDTLLT